MNLALFFGYLGCMTLLLIPAQKWAGMSPFRIEDGPSWFWASVSASYTMAFFFFAMISHVGDSNSNVGAIIGSFAFGSAIGACFLTRFKPSPEDVPNVVLRWWLARCDAFADASFKAVLVLLLDAAVTWATSFDGRFWIPVIFALSLLIGKAHKAQERFRPFMLAGNLSYETQSKVDACVVALLRSARKSAARENDAVLELHKLMKLLKYTPGETQTAEAGFRLCAARQRMLIGGNLWLTVIIGTLCLAGWLAMARPIMVTWKPAEADNYLAVLALIAGVGLHIR